MITGTLEKDVENITVDHISDGLLEFPLPISYFLQNGSILGSIAIHPRVSFGWLALQPSVLFCWQIPDVKFVIVDAFTLATIGLSPFVDWIEVNTYGTDVNVSLYVVIIVPPAVSKDSSAINVPASIHAILFV